MIDRDVLLKIYNADIVIRELTAERESISVSVG